MTAHEILARVESLGASLVAKPPDGKLVIRAPKGALSAEVVLEAKAHVDELRRLLAGNPPTTATSAARMPPAAIAPGPAESDTAPSAAITGSATLPEEAAQWIQIFGATVAEPRTCTAPTPVGPIKLMLGGKALTLTVVRHRCMGSNRFGQGRR